MYEFDPLKEIDKFASLKPESKALVRGSDFISYAVLKQKSDFVAQNLIKMGMGKQEPVGVYLDRSFDAIIVILGILKSGCICVPLDKTAPRERVRYIIENSQIKKTIFDKDSLDFEENTLINVSDLLFGEAQEVYEPREPSSEQGIMYYLYTSGSTGKPKGVRMPFRSINNLVRWQIESSGERSRKTLQFAPLSFDVSFQEIFSTLSSGSELILIKDSERFSLEQISEIINQEEITRVFLPFVALNQIIKYHHNLSSLREINVAGEQLRISNKIRDFFRNRKCILCNQYGPTETHVVSQYCLNPSVDEWKDLPPIGRPIDNVDLQVIDNNGAFVPVSEVGQIVVSGVCLFDGYIGVPDNNFINIDGRRYYKTGDFGCKDIDGDFNFFHRKDKQIKIRGHRVEMGEIENVLSDLQGIDDVIVVHVNDQLYAAIKLIKKTEDINKLLDSCKDFLSGRVPEYMLPQRYIFIESFPMTSSGKVDREKIEEMFLMNNYHSNHNDETNNSIDKILVNIWSDVLEHENFSINDNFFDVGGNSILLYKVQEQIKERLYIDIKMIGLLEFTNISGLSSYICKEG